MHKIEEAARALIHQDVVAIQVAVQQLAAVQVLRGAGDAVGNA
jgi:hypothetical protein